MFDNKIGKCEPIFKILSPDDSCKNSLCTHHIDFHLTCNMLLHHHVKIQKFYQIFTLNMTINMFN